MLTKASSFVYTPVLLHSCTTTLPHSCTPVLPLPKKKSNNDLKNGKNTP